MRRGRALPLPVAAPSRAARARQIRRRSRRPRRAAGRERTLSRYRFKLKAWYGLAASSLGSC